MRIKINADEDEQLNGLFHFAFRKYSNPNFVYGNIVTAFASGTYSGRVDPKVVLNPYADKNESYENWLSTNQTNSNITVSFLNHLFSIDSYTVQSRQGIDYNCPLEWVLEATNDMNEWKRIHYKKKWL